MSLDTVENQPKLLESGNSPTTMPKKGEIPAPEPDESIVQPEPNGAPVGGVETVFRHDNEQVLSTQVAELKQQLDQRDHQLAKERREKAELQRQLVETRQEAQQVQARLAETQRKNVELERQLADDQAKLKSQTAKKERRQEQANERLKRWREQNPERVREQNTRNVRAYRTRKRQQDS